MYSRAPLPSPASSHPDEQDIVGQGDVNVLLFQTRQLSGNDDFIILFADVDSRSEIAADPLTARKRRRSKPWRNSSKSRSISRWNITSGCSMARSPGLPYRESRGSGHACSTSSPPFPSEMKILPNFGRRPRTGDRQIVHRLLCRNRPRGVYPGIQPLFRSRPLHALRAVARTEGSSARRRRPDAFAEAPRPRLSFAVVIRPDEQREQEQPCQADLLQLPTRTSIHRGGVAQPENRS